MGRERELGVLTDLLRDAGEGRQRIALVAGDAGMGKTRFADEVAAEAARAGARPLWGRCWEGEGAPAFWPWVQVVRAYAAGVEPHVLAAEMGGGAADIAHVIPDVLESLPLLAPPPELEPTRARFRFFDSMAAFLAAATARQPLVVVLDDLHWADRASLVLCRFLARTLRDARLLLIGTYRPDEIARDAGLAAAFADLAREAEQIELHGLAVADVGHFIERTVGHLPPSAAVTAIHRRTAGNPLFVGELVRLLDADGRLDDPARAGAVAVPAGVTQAIRGRLARLSPACRETLSLAAVIGCEFEQGVLAAVARDASLPGLLDEAASAGVVVMEPENPGWTRFAHALVRDVLYEALDGRARVLAHARVVDVLAEQPDADRRVDELAHHAMHALPHGAIETALVYALRAAEQATARLAFEDAGRRYDTVLGAMRAARVADGPRECDVLIGAAETWCAAGDVDMSQRRADEAVALARRQGSADALARAAAVRAHFALTGSGDPVVVGLLEEALAALGDGAELLRARLQMKLANVLAWDGAAERREQLADAAAATARGAGDRAATGQVLFDWHWALWGVDNLDARLAVTAEMVALAEASADRKMLLEARSLRIPDLLEAGDVAGFEVEIAAHARLAEELRDRFRTWHMPLYRGLRALLAGRLDEAEHAALAAMAGAEGVPNGFALRYGGAQLFALRREQGRLDEMEAPIRALAAEHPDNRGWRAALAFLYAEIGREVEARAELEAVSAAGIARLPRDHNWLITMAFLSQASATLGDRARADELYGLLVPFAGRVVVVTPGIASTGSVSHVLAVLATTLGRYDAADRHFADALALNTRLGAVPFVAHTQREWAVMLRARGDAERAGQMLGQAIVTFERLGMRWHRERASALADRSGAEAVANSFARSGDNWTLAYDGRVVRLRHGKGLGYLAELLRHPGRHLHVIDLAGAPGLPEADASARPDAEARAAYRRRVEELRAELADAEARNDLGMTARVRDEIETLGAELAAAYGFGGRSARSQAPTERVRKAVTKCIRDDIVRIGRHHETLARHLQNAVRTGTFCVYLPERPTVWDG